MTLPDESTALTKACALPASCSSTSTARVACCQRVSGCDFTPITSGISSAGGDWCAHHGKPGSPRAGIGAVDWLQNGTDNIHVRPMPFSRPVVGITSCQSTKTANWPLAHQRQPRLPRDFARRKPPTATPPVWLPPANTSSSKLARDADGRLQPANSSKQHEAKMWLVTVQISPLRSVFGVVELLQPGGALPG